MKLYNNNISKSASDLINQYFNIQNDKEKVLFVMENLDHDGCDRYGWKSNLWALSIVYINDNEYIFYEFYKEHWNGDKSEQYTLMYKSTLSELKKGIIYLLEENLSFIEDNNLINQVKIIIKSDKLDKISI